MRRDYILLHAWCDQLNVFGVAGDGSEEPILLGGEWGFAVS